MRRTFFPLLACLPAMALFTWSALTAIDVPGVSMDSVNPDYLVVALLHPSATLPEWTLPGTLLFNRIPLLGQIYHGALPLYLGLPAYAVFGTGIIGIRVANLAFGLLVLAATAAFVAAFRAGPLVAGAVLAALALDPAFIFAFRTPFYILLLTAAPQLGSLALTEHHRDLANPVPTFLAGLLAGLAAYGYFVALFALPVLALHAWLCCPGAFRGRHATLWLAGVALGLAPYPIAALLLLMNHRLLATLSADLQILSPGQSPLSLPGRLLYVADMLRWTVQNVGPASLMLEARLSPAFASVKEIALLLLPIAGLVLGLVRPARYRGLAVVAGLAAATLVLFLVFGDRLWLQHMVPLLPVLYAGLALTLHALAIRRIAALLVVPLLVANVLDRQTFLDALRETGGAGLYSDAIDHFAEASRRNPIPTHAYFPDWGVFTPFVMLTAGRIPITLSFSPDDALNALCAGQDALLATVHGQAPERIQLWIKALPWPSPTMDTYRQRDGTPVLDVFRWHATPAADACVNRPPP